MYSTVVAPRSVSSDTLAFINIFSPLRAMTEFTSAIEPLVIIHSRYTTPSRLLRKQDDLDLKYA
ncbi:MAG: hypothetical protein LW832_03260 [Parachlamydia sp.]|nr:hypothetical protein [Parachlamydia sp.]